MYFLSMWAILAVPVDDSLIGYQREWEFSKFVRDIAVQLSELASGDNQVQIAGAVQVNGQREVCHTVSGRVAGNAEIHRIDQYVSHTHTGSPSSQSATLNWLTIQRRAYSIVSLS